MQFLTFSKPTGLFRKEYTGAFVLTFPQNNPPHEAEQLSEACSAFHHKHGKRFKAVMFTLMASDKEQESIFSFFRLVFAKAQLCEILASRKITMQFPQMSSAIAATTHERLLRKEI